MFADVFQPAKPEAHVRANMHRFRESAVHKFDLMFVTKHEAKLVRHLSSL